MSEPVVIEPANIEGTDASNIVINIVEKTFVDFIKIALLDDQIKNKLLIKLTPEMINIINKIISLTPNTFTDIEKASTEIIKDGKIDSKDIPQLIIIVQRIYQVIYNLKDMKLDSKKCSEITSTILKFIVHLLVSERKIKIDQDKQAEFLKDFDVLIDSCVGLLIFPKTIKVKGCFEKIFGKK